MARMDNSELRQADHFGALSELPMLHGDMRNIVEQLRDDVARVTMRMEGSEEQQRQATDGLRALLQQTVLDLGRIQQSGQGREAAQEQVNVMLANIDQYIRDPGRLAEERKATMSPPKQRPGKAVQTQADEPYSQPPNGTRFTTAEAIIPPSPRRAPLDQVPGPTVLPVHHVPSPTIPSRPNVLSSPLPPPAKGRISKSTPLRRQRVHFSPPVETVPIANPTRSSPPKVHLISRPTSPITVMPVTPHHSPPQLEPHLPPTPPRISRSPPRPPASTHAYCAYCSQPISASHPGHDHAYRPLVYIHAPTHPHPVHVSRGTPPSKSPIALHTYEVPFPNAVSPPMSPK
ncbi:hypothetical protein EXIGLDRAFT_312002 [Exidia glandulosa HHB12029]|uniref:Uncharacterized protein n=1 Tax=Exidia glandulosa HHB12029 TaxID=1314781 RepID=A0A165CZ64_EXIGL|nr:hypothetical protein EXIGLDRAFT_312002 [Exidia glandulosa HHB12029]